MPCCFFVLGTACPKLLYGAPLLFGSVQRRDTWRLHALVKATMPSFSRLHTITLCVSD